VKKKLIITVLALLILASAGFLLFSILNKDENGSSLNSLQKTTAAGNTDLLILVNKEHKIPDDYEVELTQVGWEKVASVMVNDLVEMRDAAARAGITLNIGSGYRSTIEQEQIYQETIAEYISQGMSEKVAKDMAAAPGYSEHQTGLAIDFSPSNTWDWLAANAHNYGFILRYPAAGRCTTGYNSEAWHYRYVGKDHAKKVFDRGIILEKYLGQETQFCRMNLE